MGAACGAASGGAGSACSPGLDDASAAGARSACGVDADSEASLPLARADACRPSNMMTLAVRQFRTGGIALARMGRV